MTRKLVPLFHNLLFLILLLSGRSENVCMNDEDCPADSENPESRRTTVYEPECVYYLAPSSIPNSGFGTYTVRDIPENTLLMHQADAPTIVLSDVRNHYERNTERQLDIDPTAVHSNYVWDGTGLADFEVDGVVEDSVTTFGALANYHPYLYNLFPTAEEFDDTITPRNSGSVGMGSYSYYGGYNYKTTRDVFGGDELFTSYGEKWLDERSFCDKVPRSNDFAIGARVVEKLILAQVQSSDLNDKFIASIRNVVSLFEERAVESLPSSVEDFHDILNQFTSSPEKYDESDIATALARKTLIPRTRDWIVSQGKCLDNLVPNISTLHDAGRGAFAQRFIPKGSLVVPAPVIQIAEASGLNTYDLETNERIGTQLVMNYCFSHQGTTLLFCPQSNAILINHCSTRSAGSYGGDCRRYNENQDDTLLGPNAYVRWATSWNADTDKYLNVSLDEILNTTRDGKRILTMEIIASRDINPGDEVFIDYGEEWEKAWEDHVHKWRPPVVTNHGSVKEMNEIMIDLKNPDELEDDPYPNNVRLACQFIVDDEEDEDEQNENSDEDSWVTTDDSYLHSIGDGEYWPCEVLERIEGGHDGIYSVEIFQSVSRDQTRWSELGIRRIIEQFPRKSIVFRTTAGSSDHYLPGVFRQPLGLPKEMLIKKWMS